MELSADQINKHIKSFTEIYNDKGEEINPIPTDRKVTVYCEGNSMEDRGFVTNVTAKGMGVEAFIAKRWIDEDEIQRLCSK